MVRGTEMFLFFFEVIMQIYVYSAYVFNAIEYLKTGYINKSFHGYIEPQDNSWEFPVCKKIEKDTLSFEELYTELHRSGVYFMEHFPVLAICTAALEAELDRVKNSFCNNSKLLIQLEERQALTNIDKIGFDKIDF